MIEKCHFLWWGWWTVSHRLSSSSLGRFPLPLPFLLSFTLPVPFYVPGFKIRRLMNRMKSDSFDECWSISLAGCLFRFLRVNFQGKRIL